MPELPQDPNTAEALRRNVQEMERRAGPMDWAQYSVSRLAEVETFIFLARGPDGQEVSGLLIRPLARPDMLFAIQDMKPIDPQAAARICPRLPAPRPMAKVPPRQPTPAYRPQQVLPPTQGQAGAPAELVAQGQQLMADIDARRQARLGVAAAAEQPQVPFAPGSIQVQQPIVYPPGTHRGQPAPAPVATPFPPDLDEGGISQG